MNAGSVYWNCCDRVSPRLPWSGHGDSGVGVTLSTLRHPDLHAAEGLAPAQPLSDFRLALFDLDETLLDGDSDVLWCEFLMDEGVLDRADFEARNREHRRALPRRHGHAGRVLRLLRVDAGGALARRAGRRCAAASWQTRILPRIGAAARALVAGHRDAGERVLLTTATNRFLTEPIATALQFAEADLIATELEEADGVFTGANAGVLNMREGKVERLAAWLASAEASCRGASPRRPSTATRRTTCRCYARGGPCGRGRSGPSLARGGGAAGLAHPQAGAVGRLIGTGSCPGPGAVAAAPCG